MAECVAGAEVTQTVGVGEAGRERYVGSLVHIHCRWVWTVA